MAENFIGILRGEERTTERAALRLGILAVLVVFFAALLADLPRGAGFFGPATGLALLALVAGAALGFTWGRIVVVRRYRASLLRSWNQWMRYSVACSRVEEVHRRVVGRPATRSVIGLASLWAVLLFVSLVLVFVTLLDGASALSAAPLFVGYAALLGFLGGRLVAIRIWVHEFVVSLDDLMRRGEISLWGVV